MPAPLPPFDGRPGVVAPAPDGGLVALACPAGGLLRAPADRLAHAADMARMVGDAECHSNHGRDPAAGPELSPEAVRFGATVQEFGQLGELLG